MRLRNVTSVLVVAAVLGLTGCTAQTRTHGWTPSDATLQEIVPGVDTRAAVEDSIGVPTTSGVLNERGFYYIESDIRAVAWRAPQVVDRRIVAITFAENGVVEDIARYGLEDGRVVPLQRRVTQTVDGDIGFIRRLFGNVGGLSTNQLLN
jgi:outer membrane protein assembly factor BamE (lipoprotein component of BamABCDE complex)